MAGRRGQNEGSITKRTDGRWMGRVTLPDGRRKAFYGQTRNEVSRKVATALHNLEQGMEPTNDKLTVREYLEGWLKMLEHRAGQEGEGLRPTTLRGYRSNVDLYLVPALGKKRLSRLSPDDVEVMLAGMRDRGLSARTGQYAHAVLRVALKHALRTGKVHRNVATLADAPRVRREPVEPLSVEEAKIFLEAAKEHLHGPLYTVALGLGLRRGEVHGLRWEDVDLDAERVWIRQTLQRQKGKGLVLVEPKTRQSRRPLALPDFVVEAFRRQRKIQAEQRLVAGPEWQDTGFVFTMEDGRPMSPDYTSKHFPIFLREIFTRCPNCDDGHVLEGRCDECGKEAEVKVPTITLHGLRHSCASLLFAQGCSMRLVMEILGHSQIALTANTYTHLLPEADREAATAMQTLLGGDD